MKSLNSDSSYHLFLFVTIFYVGVKPIIDDPVLINSMSFVTASFLLVWVYLFIEKQIKEKERFDITDALSAIYAIVFGTAIALLLGLLMRLFITLLDKALMLNLF